MRHWVVGWKLDRGERETLLGDHQPHYAEIVADHVTLEAGGKDLPGDVRAEIVGHVDDGKGVEAMVVAIDGTTARPDGSTYHITWSLGPGRRAIDSNDVIRACGWTAFDAAIPVTLSPARW
jgi:hypothetical protein